MIERDTAFAFLLRELDDTSREQLEAELIEHDEVEAELDAYEDELVEGYLDGTLDEARRQAFEARLLPTPEIQERLRLLLRASTAPAATPRIRRWAWPAGAVALAAAAAVVIAVKSDPAVRTLSLPPAGVRAATAHPTVSIGGAEWLDLELALDGVVVSENAQVVIEAGGAVVWSGAGSFGDRPTPVRPARRAYRLDLSTRGVDAALVVGDDRVDRLPLGSGSERTYPRLLEGTTVVVRRTHASTSTGTWTLRVDAIATDDPHLVLAERLRAADRDGRIPEAIPRQRAARAYRALAPLLAREGEAAPYYWAAFVLQGDWR